MIFTNKSQRCCSFCRESGHTINKCNSNKFTEFEMICAETVKQIECLDDFKNWLLISYIDNHVLIKAFAHRKLGVNSKNNVAYCIDVIGEYIFRTYKDINIIQEDLESDLVNLLGELRNPSQQEPQIQQIQIQDVEGIEYTIMHEYITALIFNDFVSQIREEHNTSRKLNINLIVDKNREKNKNMDENCKCNICWDEKKRDNFIKLGCNHEFCKDCIIKTLRSGQKSNPCCALCRSEVKSIVSKTDSIQCELAAVIS